MTETDFWSSKTIQTASETLQKIRPAYTEILVFYQQVFALQEDYRQRAVVKPIDVSAELLAAKRQASLPLSTPEEFPIDDENAEQLLVDICDLAKQTNTPLQDAARRTADALSSTDSINLRSAWANFDNEQEMEVLGNRLDVPPSILTTLLYHAARPSILVAAEQMQTYLKETGQWNKGYCPLCGHTPILALFDDDGKKSLNCGFCWHEWPLPRLFCPFCETTDANLLRYFYSKNEQEYRVDVCDKCNKYIKTVDTRKTSRLIYPALEAVATAHLDMKAQELGHAVGDETIL